MQSSQTRIQWQNYKFIIAFCVLPNTQISVSQGNAFKKSKTRLLFFAYYRLKIEKKVRFYKIAKLEFKELNSTVLFPMGRLPQAVTPLKSQLC